MPNFMATSKSNSASTPSKGNYYYHSFSSPMLLRVHRNPRISSRWSYSKVNSRYFSRSLQQEWVALLLPVKISIDLRVHPFRGRSGTLVSQETLLMSLYLWLFLSFSKNYSQSCQSLSDSNPIS